MLAIAAAPFNMGGKWRLNLDKSKWGKRDKPTGIEISIEHQDPKLKYKGTVINADGTDKRDFSFEGAIDGKEYPAIGADGAGKMSIRRVNAYTTTWTYHSNDGKVTEEAQTTISSDGKVLTRRIHRKAPNGDFVWTEVYDKVQ
jgi:hypothetical protein